ncbi:MAG: ribonuclease E inhibitor RraB [Pseudomonadota bacterium]
MSEKINWPTDIDGDVLRLLEERDFDFNAVHEIEFIIDFRCWPLSKDQQEDVLESLPEARFVEADEDSLDEGDPAGYVSLTVKNMVTYEFVTDECKRLSDLFVHMDGFCDSWSVPSACGT